MVRPAVKRRRHSAEFKARAVLPALREDKTQNQLAGEFEAHPLQITHWNRQAVEALPGIFGAGAERRAAEQAELERRLYERIGRLETELDWLKKTGACRLRSGRPMISDKGNLSLRAKAARDCTPVILVQEIADQRTALASGQDGCAGPTVLAHRGHQLLGALRGETIISGAQAAAGSFALVLEPDAPVRAFDAVAIGSDTDRTKEGEAFSAAGCITICYAVYAVHAATIQPACAKVQAQNAPMDTVIRARLRQAVQSCAKERRGRLRAGLARMDQPRPNNPAPELLPAAATHFGVFAFRHHCRWRVDCPVVWCPVGAI
jgi:transposase-like protein